MTTFFNALLVMLSLLGITDAGYLTYEELTGVIPQCTNIPGFDCGKVLQSSWSHVGPVPLAVLGLGFYLAFFLLNSVIFLWPEAPKPLKKLRILMASGGAVLSLWLMFLQAVIIGAFCLYCTLSAFISLGLFLTTWLHFWSETKELYDSTTQ